jgi:acyl transferase domain-containing protein
MHGAADAPYWKANMVSPVRFHHACDTMLRTVRDDGGADFLVEIGPSGALAGPVGQIKHQLPGNGAGVRYCAAAKRGADAVQALFDMAGRLFVVGGAIDLARVNQYGGDGAPAATVVDRPNVWDHAAK